jgi:hypothetical protein
MHLRAHCFTASMLTLQYPSDLFGAGKLQDNRFHKELSLSGT